MTISVSETTEFTGARTALTEAGIELLDGRPDISDLAASFCVTPQPSETLLEGNLYVGIGNNSQVWGMDGVAMKLSTTTTGRASWEHGGPVAPENLIAQLDFLNRLRTYLLDRSKGNLSVPEQYFAIRNRRGDFLKGEQYMEGWVSLHALTAQRHYTREQVGVLNRHTRKRLLEGVTDPLLRRGLSDLGVTRYEPLHDQNVLIPEDADNLQTAPLCIIDQPRKGIVGRLIAKAAKLQGAVVK